MLGLVLFIISFYSASW